MHAIFSEVSCIKFFNLLKIDKDETLLVGHLLFLFFFSLYLLSYLLDRISILFLLLQPSVLPGPILSGSPVAFGFSQQGDLSAVC